MIQVFSCMHAVDVFNYGCSFLQWHYIKAIIRREACESQYNHRTRSFLCQCTFDNAMQEMASILAGIDNVQLKLCIMHQFKFLFIDVHIT